MPAPVKLTLNIPPDTAECTDIFQATLIMPLETLRWIPGIVNIDEGAYWVAWNKHTTPPVTVTWQVSGIQTLDNYPH